MSDSASVIIDLCSFEKSLREINALFQGSAVWWRGHWNSNWGLVPGVFRLLADGNLPKESALCGHFQSQGIGMLRHRGKPESDIDWLFLAQHYSLKTRLLDWSESPLVALYFSVFDEVAATDSSDVDACLWALSPNEFNHCHSCPDDPGQAGNGLISPDERVVQALANQAFGLRDEIIAQRYSIDVKQLPRAIALLSPAFDERMIAQSGRFTLHGTKDPLQIFSDNEKFLRKLVIPSASKAELRKRLDWLGIRRWNLFPDLESLARDLSRREFG